MSARTTVIGPGAREALARARRDHPTARPAGRKRRPPAPIQFYAIFFVVVLLTLFGLVMVLSASSVTAIHSGRSGWTYFVKQATWAGLGLVALLAGYKVPQRILRGVVPLALAGSFGLLLAVLLAGPDVNGARAWITFRSFSIQPAEVAKLALILYTADLLARRADRMNEPRATFHPVLVVLGAACVLVMAQPDLGGVIVMAGIVFAMTFIAGTPVRPMMKAALVAGGAALVLARLSPARWARWTVFMHLTNTNVKGDGWQIWQSLVGIASGGVTGVGLGAGRAKWGYLPEAHTDFIFAIIAEELGLLGALAVIVLFALLGLMGIQVARRSNDRFEMLLAGGVTAWFLVQAIINIGGVTASLPLTGLTLPFVSFGGSSLLVSMTAAGLLLNVARRVAPR